MKKIATDRDYRVSEKEDSARYDLTKYAQDPFATPSGGGGGSSGGGGGSSGGGGPLAGSPLSQRPRRPARRPAPQAASNNAQLITQAKALMQQLTEILNKLK